MVKKLRLVQDAPAALYEIDKELARASSRRRCRRAR